MSGKIKIFLMALCLTFSHLLLAVDYVTALLLAEPLVMSIGDVPVQIRYDHGVTALVIPAGNASNAPLDRGQGGASRPDIRGHCDPDDCAVVRYLHAIQRLLGSHNIQELTLTLTPFGRTSTITHYSDDTVSSTTGNGDHISAHRNDRSSANFVLNLSFAYAYRTISIDLPYSARRSRYPMSWLWGEHFFNAHYAIQQDSTQYFDPLQEGVLADVVNTLERILTGNFCEHLSTFSPDETVSYHPCLLNRHTVQVGNGWLQPLGSVETAGSGSNGRSQWRSTVTSGSVRYSVTLPQLSNRTPFSPSIDVTLLPSLSQQLVECSRGIIAAAAVVLVAIVGIVYQSSGNQHW
ncbi:hypothetical protein [Endozoicomonas euniceicola]|uniref:N-acetylmuramoyl-L-alanine amidase n=1 Tax=Endozoicomonas euniceicola TaxID=1234143 RepID=A0ABY6GTQ2_9GAMM|nr:hypothetical protein [Endozoicomonas euniceicola]UYM16162.1 hypothetical protein NX720_25760 [Endozoicomonas euniceicola]